MARKISSRLEDLDLSQDELNRLGEALKKKEFRELLFQYVSEINDPENKKRYEEEITQLEKERGVDIKFVHPEPQYVLKTCFNPGGEKVFVNICSNALVGKPSLKPSHDAKGCSGINWSIPLIQAPPREDLDKSGVLCTVYDVLFHPDTHGLAAKDKRFRTLLEDTSLNAIEESFSVKLDRCFVKRPRMKFKGNPQPTVIRARLPESHADREDNETFINQLPYPYSMPPKEPPCARELKHKYSEGVEMESNSKLNYVTPKYVLKQSSDVDMSNYEQNLLSHHHITIPQRLVLVVDLPYVKSSSELELDIEEKKLSLVSIGKRLYKLELKLSYPVQETKGNAKFDQEAGKLIVTLVVDREKAMMKKYHLPEGDSGIESDLCGGRVSSGEEEESNCVMEGTVASTLLREDEEINTKSLEDGIENVMKLNDDCELADNKNKSATTESDMMAKLEENKIVKVSDLPCEILEEEMTGEPPNITTNLKLFENIPGTSEQETESSFSTENDIKSCQVTQGLLLPEVQYTVPSFSCCCVQEAESMAIIFVLQAKNVDPSSLKKEVYNVSGISMNESMKKSTEDEITYEGILLAPENGLVCDEYRTLGVSGIPLPGPLMTKASVNSGENLENTSCQLAPPLGQVSAAANSVKESVLVSTLDTSEIGSLVCDVSHSGSNMLEGEMKVNGAKISASETVEGELNKFRDNIVMNEGALVTKFSSDYDSPRCDKEIICFHVTFSSIGAGFFPKNFAFCVGFPSVLWPFNDLKPSDSIPANVEVWDNNVQLQFKKSSCKDDGVIKVECFVGKDPSSILPYKLPPFEEKSMESESFSEPEFSSLTSVSEDLRDEGTKDESDSGGVSKENLGSTSSTMLSVSGKREIFKERTLSESSVESITTKQATKGILKRRGRGHLGRSLSESSGGEEYSWIGSSQQLSYSSSEISRIPLGESLKEEAEEYDEEEEDDEEDGEKVKKIVRFSDVISKKTYRSNASILGQRKKNQRKLKNKKRAAERRASESENSVDEVEPTSDKANIDEPMSDLSPPQKNEITLLNNPSTMSESSDVQLVKGKPKSSVKKKGNRGKGKKVIEPPKSDDSSGNSNSPPYEFKSDLIFQLEL